MFPPSASTLTGLLQSTAPSPGPAYMPPPSLACWPQPPLGSPCLHWAPSISAAALRVTRQRLVWILSLPSLRSPGTPRGQSPPTPATPAQHLAPSWWPRQPLLSSPCSHPALTSPRGFHSWPLCAQHGHSAPGSPCRGLPAGAPQVPRPWQLSAHSSWPSASARALVSSLILYVPTRP